MYILAQSIEEREIVQSGDLLASFILPLRYLVGHVPLIAQSDNTFVCTSAHNQTLGLRVDEGLSGSDELVADLGLGIFNLAAGEVANNHSTVVEAFLVSKSLGLCKLLDVLLGIDLELLAKVRSGKLAVSSCLQNRDRVNGDPSGVDVVVGCLLSQILHSRIIIGRVRWN